MGRRAKGEGTIVQRSDGRFHGKISYGWKNGRRVRKDVYGRTKREVLEKLRDLQARYDPDADRIRLGDFLEQWVADKKSDWEPTTYWTYFAWLRNHIIPDLGQRRVGQLSRPEIRIWLRSLDEKGVGVETRRRALALLRSALNQLVDDEILDWNPADRVKAPKLKRKPVEIPSPEDIKNILLAAEPFWLFTFTLLGFTCTTRQGEMFALWWKQVDLHKGSIVVNKSLAEGWDRKPVRKTPKTHNSVRTVFIPKITIQALRKLKQEQLREGYSGPWVFPDNRGGHMLKSNFDRRCWA